MPMDVGTQKNPREIPTKIPMESPEKSPENRPTVKHFGQFKRKR